MLRQMLRGKIHRATITGCELEYEGSLTVDAELLRRSGIAVDEKVLVANLANGSRFETYAIEGGTGEIVLNGAAAHLGAVGDQVIIMCFALVDAEELDGFAPQIVHVDGQNRPVD